VEVPEEHDAGLLAAARDAAARARDRANSAGARAEALASVHRPPDPAGAAERAERARQSLLVSIRSSATAHRKAAGLHRDAARLGSGSTTTHEAEADRHEHLAADDDARAAALDAADRHEHLAADDGARAAARDAADGPA
jgi:hypothetical protein